MVEPLTLIDSGLPGSGKAVIDFMAALGHGPKALGRILLTHRHPDHSGSAAFLREATGARVFAHRGDVDSGPDGAFVRGTLGAGASRVDVILDGGEFLDGGVSVVHCGGHTAGSVAYYLEPERALFLGDMAINNVDRLSRPISLSNEDGEAHERGLTALTQVDAVSGYFGHGPPLREGLRDALIALHGRPRSPFWLAILRYVWLRARHPRGPD